MRSDQTHDHRSRFFVNCLAVLILVTMDSALQAAGPGVHGRVLASELGGKVIDVVGGAQIEFRNPAGQLVRTVTTSPSGYFKADLVAGTYFYKVNASGFRTEDCGRGITLSHSEGYAVYRFNLVKETNPNPSDGKDNVAVPPVPVTRLVGQVYAEDEKGQRIDVAGATLTLRQTDGAQTTRISTRSVSGTGQQRRSGFEAELPVGTYQAAVTAEGFEPTDPGLVVTENGRVARYDFVLRRQSPPVRTQQCIKGSVIAMVNGQEMLPPASTQVVLYALQDTQVKPVTLRLDAQGNFAHGVAPGYYQVAVQAKGYYPNVTQPSPVVAGQCTVADLVLVALPQASAVAPPPPSPQLPAGACVLTGIVYESPADAARANADGSPDKRALPEALVRVRITGTAEPIWLEAMTDSQGTYRIVLPGAGTYTSWATKDGCRPEGKRLDVRERNTTVDFVLLRDRPPCTLTVQVWSQTDKEPMPEAEVCVIEKQVTVATNKTNARGQCRFEGLSSASCTILVCGPGPNKPGAAAVEFEPAWVECTLANPAQVSAVVLRRKVKPTPLAGDQGSISVLVRDGFQSDLIPVADAQINVSDSARKYLLSSCGRSDGNGLHQTGPLPYGVYTFRVSKEGYQPAEVRQDLRKPDDKVVVALVPLAATAAEPAYGVPDGASYFLASPGTMVVAGPTIVPTSITFTNYQWWRWSWNWHELHHHHHDRDRDREWDREHDRDREHDKRPATGQTHPASSHGGATTVAGTAKPIGANHPSGNTHSGGTAHPGATVEHLHPQHAGASHFHTPPRQLTPPRPGHSRPSAGHTVGGDSHHRR